MRIHKLLHAGLVLVIFSVLCTATYAQSDDDLPQGRIVFMSQPDTRSDIMVMNLDGTHRQNLTDSEYFDAWPGWSSDGKQIVFASNRDGNMEICVMNADGTDQHNLTQHEADDSFPSWSPDGEQIIFRSNRNGNYDLYIMDADGSDPVQITDTELRETSPRWSPDAQYIAYLTQNNDGPEDIIVIEADGSNPINITQDEEGDIDFTFAWSPDSRFIAYSTNAGQEHGFYIKIFDLETRSARYLDESDDPFTSRFPTWSPDGKYIMFKYELIFSSFYVAPVDGSAPPVHVPGSEQTDFFPNWGPATCTDCP